MVKHTLIALSIFGCMPAHAAPPAPKDIATNVQKAYDICAAGFEKSGRGSDYYFAQCLEESASLWDGALNKRYTEVRKRLAAACSAKLQQAQQAWITLRDLDIDAYGAIANSRPGNSLFIVEHKIEVIRARVEFLEKLLEATAQPDQNDRQVADCLRMKS